MEIVQEMPIRSFREWRERPWKRRTENRSLILSIERFGFVVPILCRPNGAIVCGHERVRAARKMGIPHLPTIVLNLSDHESQALAIAENKLRQHKQWHQSQLANLLRRLRRRGQPPQMLGFCGPELDALLLPEERIRWEDFDDMDVRQEKA